MESNNILPVFKSCASLGRSILTVEDDNEIKDNSPVSIITLARKYDLKQLVVIDDSFLNFPALFKLCNKYNIQLIFGVNFTICNDATEKTEESLFSNSKVSVLMKNSDGYKDLIKLHNKINANKDNFYYETRGSWSILKENMTDNLQLMMPPFDNFIHKNVLENGKCIPTLGHIKTLMTYTNIKLPFTDILNNSIKSYAKNNSLECMEVHPIYYYRENDFKAYSVFRAISKRSKFNIPNLEYFSSNEFSWETYCNKSKIEFK